MFIAKVNVYTHFWMSLLITLISRHKEELPRWVKKFTTVGAVGKKNYMHNNKYTKVLYVAVILMHSSIDTLLI